MSALVLGHMNPDTDSIVSAIVAADLYSKRGMDVTPVAQGAPTPETEFVLKKFGIAAPQVVADVAGKDVIWLTTPIWPRPPRAWIPPLCSALSTTTSLVT